MELEISKIYVQTRGIKTCDGKQVRDFNSTSQADPG